MPNHVCKYDSCIDMKSITTCSLDSVVRTNQQFDTNVWKITILIFLVSKTIQGIKMMQEEEQGCITIWTSLTLSPFLYTSHKDSIALPSFTYFFVYINDSIIYCVQETNFVLKTINVERTHQICTFVPCTAHPTQISK